MAGEWAVPGLVAMVGGWVTVAAVGVAVVRVAAEVAVPEVEVGAAEVGAAEVEAEVEVAAAASRS